MKSGPGASERIPTSVRDFHRLILRTLEEKLLPEGAELQVTVARQDGGLEVIGRSRGSPERGGVLFHVERVTAPVPQGSMQNLLDRMRVEEAAHGVFLTVGTFSPEAAALAEGEPVSLFDGSSLAEILGSGPIAGTRPQDDSMGDLGLADLRPQ